MALVARNEVINCANPRLDIYLKKSGVDVDVAILEFQIFDISTPAKVITPLQVFPVIVDDREPLDPTQDCPTGHRLSTGHFTAEWTVPIDQALGSHEIRWFFKETAPSPEETFEEEFEVSSIAASSADLYVTVQSFRDMGVTTAMISDGDLEDLIRTCQALLDRACRQWFNQQTLDFFFDGTDSDTIHFGIPIVSIELLQINEATTDLATDLYKVYNSLSYPDDRHNPRIKLVRSDDVRDIFTAPITLGDLHFRKGRQNQRVKGVFGYVEADLETPDPIKRALTKLVVEKLLNPIFVSVGATPIPAPPSTPGGAVTEEWTDGHKLKFSVPTLSSRRPGLSGITSDPEILDIIKLYRAPIGVATPAHWSHGGR